MITDVYEAAFDKYFDLMGVRCSQKEKSAVIQHGITIMAP